MLTEGPGLEGLRNPCRKGKRGCRVTRQSGLPQGRHQLETGIAVKLFRHGKIGQRDIVIRAVAASGPRLGCLNQITPVVRSSPWPDEELIDALLCGLAVLRHVSLPIRTKMTSRRIVPARPGQSLDPSQGSHSPRKTRQNAASAALRNAIGVRDI